MAAISGLIAAGIGAAGAIGGGMLASSGARSAANTQAKAADQATQAQKDAYQQTRVDQAPWMQSGQTALYSLMDNLGLSRPTNPVFYDVNSGPVGSQYGNSLQGNSQTDMGSPGITGGPAPGPVGTTRPGMTASMGFQQTPGYQFQVQQATDNTKNQMAALGMAGSGDALRALGERTQGIANQEYGNYLNRLASLAGMGQTATNSVQGATTAMGNNMSSIAMTAGNNRASSQLGEAQGWGRALGQITAPGGFGQQAGNYLANSFNGGGGYGGGGYSQPVGYGGNYLSPYGSY
jgi:hypothetical protein